MMGRKIIILILLSFLLVVSTGANIYANSLEGINYENQSSNYEESIKAVKKTDGYKKIKDIVVNENSPNISQKENGLLFIFTIANYVDPSSDSYLSVFFYMDNDEEVANQAIVREHIGEDSYTLLNLMSNERESYENDELVSTTIIRIKNEIKENNKNKFEEPKKEQDNTLNDFYPETYCEVCVEYETRGGFLDNSCTAWCMLISPRTFCEWYCYIDGYRVCVSKEYYENCPMYQL